MTGGDRPSTELESEGPLAGNISPAKRKQVPVMDPDPRFYYGLIVFGVVFLIVYLFLIAPSTLQPQVRSGVARTRGDLRAIGVALESYRADHDVYPGNRPGELTDLTTPVAYLSSLPADYFKEVRYDLSYPQRPDHPPFPLPFFVLVAVYSLALFFERRLLRGMRIPLGLVKGARIAYIIALTGLSIELVDYSMIDTTWPRIISTRAENVPPQRFDYFTDGKDFWILRSLGPDGVADIPDLSKLAPGPSPGFDWQSLAYDPTNGMVSTGDVLQISE